MKKQQQQQSNMKYQNSNTFFEGVQMPYGRIYSFFKNE